MLANVKPDCRDIMLGSARIHNVLALGAINITAFSLNQAIIFGVSAPA